MTAPTAAPPPAWQTPALTALALLAFAGNSLLCRAALAHTAIDPASFTTLRLASGAVALALLLGLRGRRAAAVPVVAVAGAAGAGNWPSALALLAYAAGFSWAYVQLSTAAGALILFGAVQATMIGHGLWSGERLRPPQVAGLALAVAGLVGLLLPGLSAPPAGGALLMAGAGVAWGVYSLRGRGAVDPLRVTEGNFRRAAPLAVALSVLLASQARWDPAGALWAVLSGALASGAGYAVWYAALPRLAAATAATVQLSVPLIAALGGVALLAEPLSLRLVGAALAILGGIALVVRRPRPATAAR